jgi:hypothetical protein
MTNKLQQKILHALFLALKPLARCLLGAGIGYREFSHVAKAAFVSEAADMFRLRGRPTNLSRIAILTGITRKEAKKIRDELHDGTHLHSAHGESPASVVLSRWHSDSAYCDDRGIPLALDFDSGANSFRKLVADYAGDIPAGAMRTELVRVGAIEELAGKRLRVQKRHFVPTGLDEKLLIGLEDVLAADIGTLAYNCEAGIDRSARYHRVTSIDGLPPSKIVKVREEAKRNLTELADSFDDYLVRTADNAGGEVANSSTQIGIGLFYYEKDLKS